MYNISIKELQIGYFDHFGDFSVECCKLKC